MKKLIRNITLVFPPAPAFHLGLFFFRVLVSLQLMAAHGLKKIGIGVNEAEVVPNPLHLPEQFNQLMAIASNIVFPVFVIFGFFTRLAVLPILGVTLTGYFVLHLHDPILERDAPYMYSVAYLLILVLGPGRYSLDFFIYKKTWAGQ